MWRFLAAIIALLAGTAASTGDEHRLPDHRAAQSTGDIVLAWLVMPTDRYRHFVLGARYEAAGVRVELADGSSREFILPADSVFEDREPRLVDLDGDGRNELVLVKSTQGAGAALAVIGLRGDALGILAETPPIGRANRWMNPAGFGRFTREGTLQIALVRMPHLLGRLEIWEFGPAGLRLMRALDGFANHRIGSPHQRLSAVLPRLGSGIDLLLVPRMDRRSLVLMDLSAAGAFVAEFPLSAPIDGDIRIDCIAGSFTALVGLEDGRSESLALDQPCAP